MRPSRLKPPPSERGNSDHATMTNGVPLALLSSPSRGLDASPGSGSQGPGQSLVQHETQHRFRQHIADRLAQHAEKYGQIGGGLLPAAVFPIPAVPSRNASKQASSPHATAAPGLAANPQALTSLQEVLLLARRLREGCVASARADVFTLDVYILSVLISILVGDNIQLSASLGRLIDFFVDEEHMARDNVLPHEAEQQIARLMSCTPAKLNKPHAASLHLLWLSLTGGQAERLGGQKSKAPGSAGDSLAWHQQLRTLLGGAETGALAESKEMGVAQRAHYALARNDVVALRAVLLDEDCTLWQRALLVRAVDAKRSAAWTTLRMSYVHLAVDAALLGGTTHSSAADDWVERMLLIDVELLPPSEAEQREVDHSDAHDAKTDVREEWDQSIGDKSERGDDTRLTQQQRIRAMRLRNVFVQYELPGALVAPKSATGIAPSPAQVATFLAPWQGRMVMQAGAPVLKLR